MRAKDGQDRHQRTHGEASARAKEARWVLSQASKELVRTGRPSPCPSPHPAFPLCSKVQGRLPVRAA